MAALATACHCLPPSAAAAAALVLALQAIERQDDDAAIEQRGRYSAESLVRPPLPWERLSLLLPACLRIAYYWRGTAYPAFGTSATAGHLRGGGGGQDGDIRSIAIHGADLPSHLVVGFVGGVLPPCSGRQYHKGCAFLIGPTYRTHVYIYTYRPTAYW